MTDPKPFASLSPSLLARKGSARPAMRPQLQPLSYEEQHRLVFGSGQDDLGWNDMGHDAAASGGVAPRPVADPAITLGGTSTPAGDRPEVLRRIETLAGAINGRAAAATAPAAEVPAEPEAATPESTPQPSRRRGSALKEGRKAAFTLRLDAERHLRLRLACTVENRSAQQLVVEALDRFLETMPGLDDLARRVRR